MRSFVIAVLALTCVSAVVADSPRERRQQRRQARYAVVESACAQGACTQASCPQGVCVVQDSHPGPLPSPQSTASTVASASECREALDEVNADRAKHGLSKFQHDPLLSKAAYACAKARAVSHIYGHLPSDFDYLPPGAHATAAGCGALEPSWGWGTCCTHDSYTYAGAAWVMGDDGRRYMHLFVR